MLLHDTVRGRLERHAIVTYSFQSVEVRTSLNSRDDALPWMVVAVDEGDNVTTHVSRAIVAKMNIVLSTDRRPPRRMSGIGWKTLHLGSRVSFVSAEIQLAGRNISFVSRCSL